MFFAVSEEAESRVLQMPAVKRQPDLFSRGLTEALATIGEGDSQAELRLFQVPILKFNFEALWLSYEGEGQDMLIPLHTVGRLAQYKPVRVGEALDALREAARPLANMDDGRMRLLRKDAYSKASTVKNKGGKGPLLLRTRLK